MVRDGGIDFRFSIGQIAFDCCRIAHLLSGPLGCDGRYRIVDSCDAFRQFVSSIKGTVESDCNDGCDCILKPCHLLQPCDPNSLSSVSYDARRKAHHSPGFRLYRVCSDPRHSVRPMCSGWVVCLTSFAARQVVPRLQLSFCIRNYHWSHRAQWLRRDQRSCMRLPLSAGCTGQAV